MIVGVGLFISNIPATLPVNLILNGDVAENIANWSQVFGAVSWQNGRLRCTTNGAQDGRAAQGFACVVGGIYRAAADVMALNIAPGGSIFISTGTNLGGAIASDQSGGVKSKAFNFTATATLHYMLVSTGVGTAGAWAEFKNMSVTRIG